MPRRIVVLHEFSAWQNGNHVHACINLLKGMVAHGGDVHLDLPRTRVDMGEVPYRASIPWPISRFGLPRLEPALRRAAGRRFLARLRDGDIAWLWTATPLDIYEELRRRGNPIVQEVINTRVAYSRRILSAIHDAEGLPPPPSKSNNKAEREDTYLGMVDHAFASSPAIEASLRAEDSTFRGTLLPTSYGAFMPVDPPVEREGTGPVTVLFVGTLSVRKNVQGLLRAWARADTGDARLKLVGPMTPEIRQLCATELQLPSVEAEGSFVTDLDSIYRSADVFVIPSHEEGDPRVTYEAMGYGLPIIASPMGGGRAADWTDAIHVIDPTDPDDIAAALTRFVQDAALRTEYRARSRAAAPKFDWLAVGGDRLRQLQAI
ncbi:MAG: glycosyltransferase family 4 protein [Pseudomonadota bacterium]